MGRGLAEITHSGVAGRRHRRRTGRPSLRQDGGVATGVGTSVRVERDGPVTVVTIDRPEVRNAVDRRTAQALADAFRAFDADARSDWGCHAAILPQTGPPSPAPVAPIRHA